MKVREYGIPRESDSLRRFVNAAGLSQVGPVGQPYRDEGALSCNYMPSRRKGCRHDPDGDRDRSHTSFERRQSVVPARCQWTAYAYERTAQQ